MEQTRASPTRTYYSIREAASMLNMNYNTVMRLVNSGRIKAKRYGKLWRIEASEIDGKESEDDGRNSA